MINKKKIFKYSLYVIAAAFVISIVGIIYYFSTFSLFDAPTSKEIKRITSPDGLVDALIVENYGNATTSNSYLISIVPKGEEFKKGYENMLADHSYNLDISWDGNKNLLIKYDEARIFNFSNFWNSDKIQNWEYVVELKLVPLRNSSLSERDKGNY